MFPCSGITGNLVTATPGGDKEKLIGSKQEQDFRKELEASNLVSVQDRKAETILNVLRATFGELKSAYILNWTPE
ncbi:hypothetical protein ACI1P2_10645 [Paenibacillus sp. p-8]